MFDFSVNAYLNILSQEKIIRRITDVLIEPGSEVRGPCFMATKTSKMAAFWEAMLWAFLLLFLSTLPKHCRRRRCNFNNSAASINHKYFRMHSNISFPSNLNKHILNRLCLCFWFQRRPSLLQLLMYYSLLLLRIIKRLFEITFFLGGQSKLWGGIHEIKQGHNIFVYGLI